MDYFEGIKNEEFVAFFLEDLNCRKELTQYIYPHETTLETEDVIDDHIARCQNILKEYMRELVIENALEEDNEISYDNYEEIVMKRLQEVLPLLEPFIMKYLENTKITYIDFTENNHPKPENIDYLKSIKIEDFVTYYTQILHSRMDIVQFDYPEIENEDFAVVDHLRKCHELLATKIELLLHNVKKENGERLSQQEIKINADSKIAEILPLIRPIGEKYFEESRVTYISADYELIEIELDNEKDDEDYDDNEDNPE